MKKRELMLAWLLLWLIFPIMVADSPSILRKDKFPKLLMLFSWIFCVAILVMVVVK